MKIVAGFIRTPEGRAALERAIQETRIRAGHLVVVHSPRKQEDDAAEAIAYQREFDKLDSELESMGLPHTMRILTGGMEPAEDIVQVAVEEDAGLIVIGLRRRTRTGKFLLGSNAHDILMNAHCPVLAVQSAKWLGAQPFLQTKGLTKQFPGVLAVDQVDIDIRPGEVIGLVGKNGAGKTTLIKMLAGVEAPDEGEILLEGRTTEIRNPRSATELGLAFLHQELLDAPNLSAAENISLGLGYPRRAGFLVDWPRLNQRAQTVLDRLEAEIDPRAIVRNLSIVKQRLVMIARAVNRQARLVVLDEPTASLSDQEVRHLHDVVKSLREEGVAVLYVSHRLDEILSITDRTVVMRDGRVVADQLTETLDRDQLVALITGGLTGLTAATRRQDVGVNGRPDTPELLRVENLSQPGVVEDCSFDLREGELLGIAGLVGSGRSELMHLLFGADRRQTGTIYISGKAADIRSPKSAMQAGIALLPEDRRSQGAVMEFSVRENLTLATLSHHRLSPSIPLVSKASERAVATEAVERLGIMTPHIEQLQMLLSGGNQQKVVLAKWLEQGADVFIFDEPTRGIDVEGKEEFYRLMEAIAATKKGVIFISSELDELVAVCQRVLIMRKGRLVGELEGDAITEERIVHECFTA